MRSAAAVAVLVCATAVVHADPPKLDDVIHRAIVEGKPLVVAFKRTCNHSDQSCDEYARSFAEPRVVAAMRGVIFVEYDIASPQGTAAAALFEVRMKGSSELLVFRDDRVADRESDTSPEGLEATFDRARREMPTLAALESTARRFGNEPGIHRRLAVRYRALGRIDDAIDQLRELAGLTSRPRNAEALGEATLLVLKNDPARAAEAIAAFAETFPDSPLVSLPLAALAATKFPRDELRELVVRHLRALPVYGLTNAVRLAAMVGLDAEARSAVQRWHAAGPSLIAPKLLRLELEWKNRDKVKADLDAACFPIPDNYEIWCRDLVAAFMDKTDEADGMFQLRANADLALAGKPIPREDHSEDAAFRARHDLSTSAFSPYPRASELIAESPEPLGVHHDTSDDPIDPDAKAGLVIGAFDREWAGASSATRGFDLRFAYLPYRNDVAAMIVDLQVGGGVRGQFDGLEGAMRGMFGVGTRSEAGNDLTILGGFGGTQLGPELALEIRLRLPFVTTVAHAWGRSTQEYFDGTSVMHLQIGAAASFAVHPSRLYVAATADLRGSALGGSILVGIPFGSYF